MTESEQGYSDKHDDIWVRVRPDRYALAGSERHAVALLDCGGEGATLKTIDALFGPLKPVIVD